MDKDFDVLTKKIAEEKMYTFIEIHPGGQDVDFIVHEAARAESPTSTDYGMIRL